MSRVLPSATSTSFDVKLALLTSTYVCSIIMYTRRCVSKPGECDSVHI